MVAVHIQWIRHLAAVDLGPRLAPAKVLLGALLAFSFITNYASASQWRPEYGQELIGRKAPEFKQLAWLNSKPMTLASLRGKVVLIRFWLIGCPNCAEAVRVLMYMNRKYGKDGLVAIGIHHPKSREGEDPNVVLRAAHQLSLDFPLATDNSWATLDEYWMGPSFPNHPYTSASFLIDKDGYIRWVHDGGELSIDSPAAKSLEDAVKQLIAEKQK